MLHFIPMDHSCTVGTDDTSMAFVIVVQEDGSFCTAISLNGPQAMHEGRIERFTCSDLGEPRRQAHDNQNQQHGGGDRVPDAGLTTLLQHRTTTTPIALFCSAQRVRESRITRHGRVDQEDKGNEEADKTAKSAHN